MLNWEASFESADDFFALINLQSKELQSIVCLVDLHVRQMRDRIHFLFVCVYVWSKRLEDDMIGSVNSMPNETFHWSSVTGCFTVCFIIWSQFWISSVKVKSNFGGRAFRIADRNSSVHMFLYVSLCSHIILWTYMDKKRKFHHLHFILNRSICCWEIQNEELFVFFLSHLFGRGTLKFKWLNNFFCRLSLFISLSLCAGVLV